LMVAKDYERLRLQTQGEYGGIGVQIDKRNDWITVIAPLPGTPGARAGLQAGDQIIEVDGESTKDWSTDIAVSKLRGAPGSTVNIKIGRVGADQPIPIALVREEIHLQAVPSRYMMPGNVGYVELVSFSESSTDELRQAVQKLRTEGAKGIILDLRGNPGGLLEQGVAVSDLFLDRGQVVVETKGRALNQNHRAQARTPDEFPGLPIVVLVEPNSASASEIVAGALQDHDRALVVGRTTYGKGSVQTLFPLSGENWLKITTARWYTPSGRSIQKPYGIDAPHEVEEEQVPNPTPSAAAEDTKNKPAYKTDAGRTVYGGGGIVPDLVLMPDTLTADERLYRQETLKQLAKYVNARLSFAVEYLRSNPGLRQDFEVTPAIRDAFFASLPKYGVKIEKSVFDRATRLVSSELGVEITYSKWGQQAVRQRMNAEDPQVAAAAELLRKATTPNSLFSLAASFDAQQQANAVRTPGAAPPPAPR
jgi:carboxyl-terminal processing protease